MNKEYRKTSELRLWDRNPRSIKKADFERLKSQIKKLGQYKPLLINKDNVVLGGNMRLRAYLDMGIDDVWVSEVDAQTEKEMVEYALSDNDRAGYYDEEVLAELVLSVPDLDLSQFKVDLGDAVDLQSVIDKFGPTPEVFEDDVPEDVGTRCQLGDVWQLGNHRLMCGDSTKIEDVEKLMNGQKADMVFTDPPFPNNSGIMHDMIDGIDRAFDNARAYCNGLMIFFWDNLFEPDFSESITSKLIWHKTNGWQAGHYETMYCYHGDNKRHEQIVYSEVSVGSNNIRSEVGNHQTPKPPSLLPLVIGEKYSSILDLFLGSGSTLIACEQTNRICYGMELDPKYCDVIIQRWENFTGKTATPV